MCFRRRLKRLLRPRLLLRLRLLRLLWFLWRLCLCLCLCLCLRLWTPRPSPRQTGRTLFPVDLFVGFVFVLHLSAGVTSPGRRSTIP